MTSRKDKTPFLKLMSEEKKVDMENIHKQQMYEQPEFKTQQRETLQRWVNSMKPKIFKKTCSRLLNILVALFHRIYIIPLQNFSEEVKEKTKIKPSSFLLNEITRVSNILAIRGFNDPETKSIIKNISKLLNIIKAFGTPKQTELMILEGGDITLPYLQQIPMEEYSKSELDILTEVQFLIRKNILKQNPRFEKVESPVSQLLQPMSQLNISSQALMQPILTRTIKPVQKERVPNPRPIKRINQSEFNPGIVPSFHVGTITKKSKSKSKSSKAAQKMQSRMQQSKIIRSRGRSTARKGSRSRRKFSRQIKRSRSKSQKRSRSKSQKRLKYLYF